MKRLSFFVAVLVGGLVLLGADGCSSDPNVEGAKLDLRNKDYDRALENVETALEKNPDNAEALELKGQILQEMAFATNDPEEHTELLQEMLAAYERARTVDPELGSDIDNRLDVAYFNEFQRGVQAFQRGQEEESAYGNAAQYFDNAAAIRPDSSGAYVNKAFSLINAGRTEEAIEPFEKAIETGDNSVETYLFLEELYRTYGQPEKAVDLLKQAREKFPQDADVQARLMNAYIAAGRLDEAMEEYRAQVEREPTNKLYQYNYGSLLLEAERYDEAIEHLSKAVEIDPEYANARYNLGASYINKAVTINEEVSQLDDEIRENRAQLSDAEIREKEARMDELAEQRRQLFEEAIPHLEKAKELAEANNEDVMGICQALFQAYVHTGQNEQAEAYAECAGYELN